MKQVQRFVIVALALVLIGLPAVTMAQTPSSPATSSDKATDKAPSASPSTAPSTDSGAKSGSGTAGQASPGTPMSLDDCKNNGWQKFGLKSEAECSAKVKK